MEKLELMNQTINAIVWGKFMIIALLGIGTWFTIRCHFLPFVHPMLIMKKTLGSLFHKKTQRGVSSFQAVSTALAGTLGVGSIVGVATALQMGGAGALFWLCVSSLLGMMCKYAEIVTAMLYRQRRKDGSMYGGAMTALEFGCRLPFLAICFALFCILASFGIGNLTPVHTIIETITYYHGFPKWWISFGLMLIVAFCMFHKKNTILKVNERLIPLISIVYLTACIYLLFIQREQLASALTSILQDAFQVKSGVGGVAGFFANRSIHYGIARGVFSNEAGMGSSPLSHASVEDAHPVEQGFWGIFEVFFDSLVVCLLSGLVCLTSPMYEGGKEGVQLIIACFEQGFPLFGGALFSFAMISFALPSILGWYYYARQCILYISEQRIVLFVYQCIFLLLMLSASQVSLDFVWNLADTLNGLMAVPNIISLVILSKSVIELTKEYVVMESGVHESCNRM